MEKRMINRKDVFIGREEELSILGENVFVLSPGAHAFYALTGPNEIGKTHIFKRLRADWETEVKAQGIKDVFCVPMSVRQMIEYPVADSYWWFWICLINACKEFVPLTLLEEAGKAQPEAYRVIEWIYAFYAEESNYGSLQEGCMEDGDILALFQAYTTLGVQIILAIDEFCHMTEFYPEWSMELSEETGAEGAEERQVLREAQARRQKAASRIFSKLRLLSPKGMYSLNLTLLVMGRRTLKSFRYEMENNSDFANAFENMVLQGFNNEELRLYREMYQDGNIIGNLGRELTDGEFSDILYYCGRHPGLLMKMHGLICTYKRTHFAKGVAHLYQQQGRNLRNVYSKLYELMKQHNVNRYENKSCIGTFMQLYFTPIYEKEQFLSQLESLCDFGFLLIPEEETIFDMAGEKGKGLAKVDYKGTIYEPIAPHFAYFLKAENGIAGSGELYGLMARTELLVREWISMVYAKKYPDTWKNVLHSMLNNTHTKFHDSLEEKADKYAARERGIEYSPLDVLSYEDYANIISADWDIYKSIFSFYTKEELNRVFVNVLKSCRNDVMHINQRMLDDAARKELENACLYILEESTKVKLSLEGIVPLTLSHKVSPEGKKGNGKRYLYAPVLKDEGGKKWVEGYLIYATFTDENNPYCVEDVRYYRATLTNAAEVETLENGMDAELGVYVGAWKNAEAFYCVYLEKDNIPTATAAPVPALVVASVPPAPKPATALKAKKRKEATPSPKQQEKYVQEGKNVHMLHELSWEDAEHKELCGYIYYEKGPIKFKAKLSAHAVGQYLEKAGIDLEAGLPAEIKVTLRKWKDDMGAFRAGYAAQ